MNDTNGTITLKCGENITKLYKAMCNLTPYDPTHQYCSVQGIFDLEKCGDKLYNPESHLCDTRDSSLYRYVAIGSQIWMAENLNYKTENSSCGGESATSEGDCPKYGRLYTWAAAVGKSEDECGRDHICGLSGEVRGVCPEGWHLPSSMEWNTLYTAVGGIDIAGKILKSQTGWRDSEGNSGGNGTDAYGFSVLPASNGYSYAYFWGVTENYGDVYNIALYNCLESVDPYYSGKYGVHSVRCLKDSYR